MTGWQQLLKCRILLWRGLWLTPLALALTELFFLPYTHVPLKAYLVTLAASVILMGHLLSPTLSLASFAPAARTLLWSLLVAGAGLLLILLQAKGILDQIQSLHLVIAIFVITFTLQSLNRLLASWCNETFAPALTLMAGILFAAAPLWLGPWAADADTGQLRTNAIVATSPLTYLSVAINYDYLRSNWFYIHTPLGALRYHYPSAVQLGTIYLALAVACLALRRSMAGRLTRHHRD